MLKDIDREKTNIGYYHWSNARISTPISFSSTDYILERDIEQVKDRVELENEIMSEYKEKMTALENEQKGVYKHYNLLVMFIWLCVLLMTCFMCPVYIVKKKHETKLTNDIDARKKNLAKELLSKIDFIDSK